MVQAIAFLSENSIDIGVLVLSCTLILINFLFGGIIAVLVFFKCIVPMCRRGVLFIRRQSNGRPPPAHAAVLGFLSLAIICFGIGITIFDCQLSSKLKHGAVLVDELWHFAFSLVSFDASVFMFIEEIQKFRGKFNG